MTTAALALDHWEWEEISGRRLREPSTANGEDDRSGTVEVSHRIENDLFALDLSVVAIAHPHAEYRLQLTGYFQHRGAQPISELDEDELIELHDEALGAHGVPVLNAALEELGRKIDRTFPLIETPPE